RSFFFSSRRRHTRSKRDWSSDVCSSDLITITPGSQIPPNITGGICEPGVIVMLGGIPPFAGEIAGFLAACVTCAVQDAIKATARSEERRVGKGSGSRWSAAQRGVGGERV